MTMMKENEQMSSIDHIVVFQQPCLRYANEYFELVLQAMYEIVDDHRYPKEDVVPNNLAKYHKHEMLLLQEDKVPKMLHSM
jgi:hypothetical protein